MELIEQHVSALAEKLGTTPEVMTKFLSDASAAEEVKPFVDSLGGLHVFTQDDLTARIANDSAELITKARNEGTGNAYGALDKRIFKETGIAKLSEKEPTAEYATRAYKERFGSAGNESEELQRLRADIQAKDELLNTQNATITQLNTKLETMEVEGATKVQQARHNAGVDSKINALPIQPPAGLAEAEAQAYIDSQREFLKFKFDQRYAVSFVDGKAVHTDKVTGKEVRGGTRNDLLSADQILEQFAPTVVSLKNVQKNGTGLNTTGNSNSDTKDFAAYDTLEAYQKSLTTGGITLLSQKGQQLQKEYLASKNAK